MRTTNKKVEEYFPNEFRLEDTEYILSQLQAQYNELSVSDQDELDEDRLSGGLVVFTKILDFIQANAKALAACNMFMADMELEVAGNIKISQSFNRTDARHLLAKAHMSASRIDSFVIDRLRHAISNSLPLFDFYHLKNGLDVAVADGPKYKKRSPNK